MFYSHEVLTSRKYGVATIWLVATLGSKSSLKKVSRKQILDVNVVKACDTIVEPEAPMALRLQSSLLYGVTRVYAQQCGYVLLDAEAARNNMRAMLKTMKQVGLEPEGANKARADQINLQDDPNFLPDLEMLPMDLDNLNFTYMEDTQQSALSPHSSLKSRPTTGSQQSIGGLIIPPSNSSNTGGPVGGAGLFSIRGDSGPGAATKIAPRELADDDLGLDYGQDIDFGSIGASSRQPRGPFGGSERTDDAAGDAFGAPDQPKLDDEGYVPTGDDFNPIGDYPLDDGPTSAHDQTQHETTSETATASNKKSRTTRKTVQVDKETNVPNSQISNWNKTYLDRMRAENKRKQNTKAAAIAKSNADYWMRRAHTYLDHEPMHEELQMFAPGPLMDLFKDWMALREKYDLEDGEKRQRDVEDEGEAGPTKRRRAEPSSEELARGEQQYEDFMPLDDDNTIEQGREAPTPLDDRHLSSLFPWNQSAGSRRPTDAHPTSASFGGGPQLNLLPRRGSRLTSASPLVDRGVGGMHIDDFELDAGFGDAGDMGGVGEMGGEDQFELYGAAAQVDTQTAAQSQWQKSVLTSESANFLGFVETAIDENEEQVDSIDFEALLPPENNSNIVAAQAMLHVLTLGTKGLIKVRRQNKPFDPIVLQLVGNSV